MAEHSLNLRFAFTMTLLTSLGLSCRSAPHSDSKLIGGKITDEEKYAAVLTTGYCTSTLISENSLVTAAHCEYIFSGPGAGKMRNSKGSKINLRNATSSKPLNRTVTVKKVHIHPSWTKACTAEKPCDPKRGASAVDPKSSDVAIVEFEESIKEIKPTKISLAPVATGESVELLGFGCEGGINTGQSGRKKVASLKVADGEQALDHEGSEKRNTIKETVLANFVTLGIQSVPKDEMPESASLCPGDSGGPALRLDATDKDNPVYTVVGVSGDYTFTEEYETPGAVAKTNVHTRFDYVADWFISVLGADKIADSKKIPEDLFLLIQSSGEFTVSATKETDKVFLCLKDSPECTFEKSLASSSDNQEFGPRKWFKFSTKISQVAKGEKNLKIKVVSTGVKDDPLSNALKEITFQ